MNAQQTRQNQKVAIPTKERVVVVFAAFTLAFTAWGFAGVIPWTAHTLLTGGVLTFFAALLPMPNPKSSLVAVRKLLRFPVFWPSLLFLVYLAIQAFNPSVTVVHGDGGWWVEKMAAPLATWLPSGVRSEYSEMNAFRVLEWFAASFALMWGIWLGLTHRKSVLILLWVLVLSGSLMGMVAILQSLSDADTVLWTLRSANEKFWGSFFYRNQGAAYLNLILIATGFMYFYHAKKATDRGRFSGPHFLLFALLVLVAVSVAMALSRGGIIFGGGFVMSFLVLATLQKAIALYNIRCSWKVVAVSGLLLVTGVYALVSQINLTAIQERFGDVEATIENADEDARYLATQATWDMAQDNLLLGWGAGSFRFIFPIYQQEYPAIFYRYYIKKYQRWWGRRIYHYAHNDIVQFLAEYGIIGCSLLLLCMVFYLFHLIRCLGQNFFSICLLLVGLICILGHAFLDFILNSPAYWVAFVGVLALTAKLLQLERFRARVRRSQKVA